MHVPGQQTEDGHNHKGVCQWCEIAVLYNPTVRLRRLACFVLPGDFRICASLALLGQCVLPELLQALLAPKSNLY